MPNTRTGRIRQLTLVKLADPAGKLRTEFEAAFGKLTAAERPFAAADLLGKRLRTLRDRKLQLRLVTTQRTVTVAGQRLKAAAVDNSHGAA